jgi:hypothetical protein
MKRFELINKLIKHYDFKSYLEIGVRNPDDNLNIIDVQHKDGVDPAGGCNYPVTSDEFFSQIDKNKKYDIVFIDGLHHDYQVIRDIENSLNHLSENGIIVCHDCLPFSELMQRKEECVGEWTGDVWKAIAKFRIERNDLEINVVDTDYGLGIIRKGKDVPFKYNGEELTYDFYVNNRDSLLNVITVDEFNKHYLKMLTNKDSEDIFIVDCWLDTKEKEDTLINLIEILRNFKIPILLCGHYPANPEIQKMVDYYIYDGNNDILLEKDFEEYGVVSDRWTIFNGAKISNKMGFHHDYAIWETMRNAFNYAKYLGKKYIHFLEYDNLPDPTQYKQAFLEYSRKYDAIIYEYSEKSSVNKSLSEFCSTYIFSIKIDTAINLISKINSKREYFTNRPNGWQLERVFLKYLKEVTNSIFVSQYIPNNNELNVHAVWNRDHIDRNGGRFQIYLAVDNLKQLYIHFISGFTDKPADIDYIVDINYGDYKNFYTVKKNQYHLVKLGKYRENQNVTVYHRGVEVFNQFLNMNFNKFYKLNKLEWENKITENIEPKEITVNFIDGPFIEIKDSDELERDFEILFINKKTNEKLFNSTIKDGWWTKCSLKYFIDWKIIIKSDSFYNEYDFDLTNKRVLISFESKSLGDNLAWMPYVEKFMIDRKCEVICSTFFNGLFRNQYPDITFVEPGSTVDNIHALYRLGLFYVNNEIDYTRHPSTPITEPLAKVASDILGLDYVELKPKLPKLGKKKYKRVCIATHSTSQCKYWNNPTGWQDVVDYLNEKGYEVRLLSREHDGYMGNKNPIGVVQQPPSSVPEILKTIEESELFIGISSGLSWLSWASGTPTILISGFTDDILEPKDGIVRIINKDVCHGCWQTHKFNPGDWNWCPIHKGTEKQFECSKMITSDDVIKKISSLIS